MFLTLADQLALLQRIAPAHAALAIAVCLAAAIDARTMRVPNWLTFGAFAAGLVFSVVAPAPGNDLWRALGGAATGLACTLPFYVVRVMGAGDAKLMAAVGAFVGFPAVLGALAYIFVAGGVVAIVLAIRRRALKRLAINVGHATQGLLYAALAGVRGTADVPQAASVGKLPYGLAICTGTLAWLAFPSLL
jgi:prepilin peptidase CpaA